MSTFDECLAWILERESGYRQTVGRPYVRTGRGEYWDAVAGELVAPSGTRRGLPTKADGMAYDDDPHDTGGRTCMGVIKRVYDAFRTAAGRPHQDVWRIADDEIRDIYFRQYWLPIRGDELPPGLDVKTFDMAVNAGIATGARCLQRAVGTKVDGHIGEATLAAAKQQFAANPNAVLQRLHDEREAYYKQCRTYWKHGPGWLRRNDLTLREALEMVAETPRAPQMPPIPVSELVPDHPVEPVRQGGAASAKPEPVESMGQSTTARAAEGLTGTGVAGTGATVAKAVKDAPTEAGPLDILLAVLSDPIVWLFLITMAGGVYVWIERRRLIRMMGV